MLWKNGDEKDLYIQGTWLQKLQISPRLPSGLPMELTNPPLPSVRVEAEHRENCRLMLENCCRLATRFLPTSLRTYTRLLDAIGAALFDSSLAHVECNRPEVLSTAIWKYDTLGFIFEDFLTLAVHLDLFRYVEDKVSRLQPGIQAATASRLLIVATLKCQKWLEQSSRFGQEDLKEDEHILGVDKESKHASELSGTAERDWAVLDREEAGPSFHMMQILMGFGTDTDFEAWGTSARQVMDLRRWELAGSPNFQKISQSFDFAKETSGGLTRRAKGVFHRLEAAHTTGSGKELRPMWPR